jgi:hypothetical protein
MCNVDCPYSAKCLSFKKKCGSCVYNRNLKQDFYSPMPNPYPYWWPWNPWYQVQPAVTWITNVTSQTGKCDYYSNNSDVPVTC